MKQTIQLEGNRKATIEIPYSKFTASASNYQRAAKESTGCDCDSKVIMMNCGGSNTRSNNFELKAIIADL